MKGLIVCFAVVCLSLASGAPTDEASKLQSKSFSYDKKNVIYSLKPFSKEEMVYAVCEGSTAEKKCKVYVESADQDKSTVQSCDVNLKYTGRFDFHVVLANAGNSKAILAVREGAEANQLKLISVNLKGCQIKEASVAVPQQFTRQAELPLQVAVVAHENNYDVVYKNQNLCKDFLCKATFDYEGKEVKAPAVFPVKEMDYSFYQIVANDKAYLVAHVRRDLAKVYLVHDDDKEAHTLFSSSGGVAAVSAEENKLSYCAHSDNKVECKQFDAEGKTEKTKIEIATGKGHVDYLDVLNLEKGLLQLSVNHDHDSKDKTISVAHFDEQGKQVKSVNVDMKCDKLKLVIPKLYKKSEEQYCVSYICMPPLDSPDNHAEFSRHTQCVNKAELF